MNKTIKVICYTLFCVGILTIIGILVANKVVENKVIDFLERELPKNMKVSYDEISLNTLNGTAVLQTPNFTIQNGEYGAKHTFFNAEKLVISGFGYWDYLFKNEIQIDRIAVERPIIDYYKDRVRRDKDSVLEMIKLEKPIFVDRLEINNSIWTTYDQEKDSIKVFAKNLFLNLQTIYLDQETINRKIPFNYGEIFVKGDSLFVKANIYENFATGNFFGENGDFLFTGPKYYTKYSKPELSKILNVQRDHYNLEIDSLRIQNFSFGFKNNLFYTSIKSIGLNQPRLEIYRDKLVAEDPTFKPLYSKLLRDLPFDLSVDSITLMDGAIRYEERVKEENTGGYIQFRNMNADFINVGNTYKKPISTEIKIQAIFMDTTPFEVAWNFDVNKEQDEFVFQAKVGPLEAEKMNRFTEPNLKVRLKGRANRTFFTIDGNDHTSVTDLKINYSDFKIELLRKDGVKKNKLLSAVVNIFVSKNSAKKEETYKEATGNATRDKTKSIFNFLWISVLAAIQKVLL